MKMTKEHVLTPGGWRHRSLVHRIENGHAICMAEEGRARMTNLASKALSDFPEHVVRPGDVPGFGTGWITYASWTNSTGTPVSSFQTTFKVPPVPKTSSGQTIFLFPGIDPSDPSKAILQPVLQWGSSHAGGGPYWTVASWYVLGSGQAFYTPLVNVNVGDTLVGTMKLTGHTGGKFSYTSEFEGIPGTLLTIQNVDELVWCNETLEAYGVTACSDYPDTDFTAMSNANILTGGVSPAMSWTPNDLVTDCGQHTLVPHNTPTGGEVDLYYRNPIAIDLGALLKITESVRILFGVTNDGGGIVMLPNGHIIRIPPRSPLEALFKQIADGVENVGRGFAVREHIQGTSIKESGEVIGKASLELMARGLEAALEAVKKEIGA